MYYRQPETKVEAGTYVDASKHLFSMILNYFNKNFYCGEVFQNKINTRLQNHKNGLTE